MIDPIVTKANGTQPAKKAPRWQKFWFVWGGPAAREPRFRHESLVDAVNEAKRLSALHPMQPYFVLSAKCLVRTPKADATPRVRWFQREPTALSDAVRATHPSDEALVEVEAQP